jgi:delta-aminolevulinic acid dehydratase/porphobilinogen synthase
MSAEFGKKSNKENYIINNAEKHRIEVIATICHNVNKAYCEALCDESQVSWYKLPEEIKQSVRLGVKKIMLNPYIDAEEMHEEWVKDKKKNGWKLGDIKDIDKKTHPNLVSFNKLPKEEQAKDYIFISIVRQLMYII